MVDLKIVYPNICWLEIDCSYYNFNDSHYLGNIREHPLRLNEKFLPTSQQIKNTYILVEKAKESHSTKQRRVQMSLKFVLLS